jgi:hypothetical protein
MGYEILFSDSGVYIYIVAFLFRFCSRAGIVVNFMKKSTDEVGQMSNEVASNYLVDVLLRCKKQQKGDQSRPQPITSRKFLFNRYLLYFLNCFLVVFSSYWIS